MPHSCDMSVGTRPPTFHRMWSASEAHKIPKSSISRCLPVQILQNYSPFDMSFLLISFTLCFSVGLLLSLALIYLDVQPYKTYGRKESIGPTYLWERVLAVLFGACQAGLAIAGITAMALALRSKGHLHVDWAETAVRCNLQLLAGTNVRQCEQTCRAC
jgi:hypothetical protein